MKLAPRGNLPALVSLSMNPTGAFREATPATGVPAVTPPSSCAGGSVPSGSGSVLAVPGPGQGSSKAAGPAPADEFSTHDHARREKIKVWGKLICPAAVPLPWAELSAFSKARRAGGIQVPIIFVGDNNRARGSPGWPRARVDLSPHLGALTRCRLLRRSVKTPHSPHFPKGWPGEKGARVVSECFLRVSLFCKRAGGGGQPWVV